VVESAAMSPALRRNLEIGGDVVVAAVAYYLFRWPGLALWAFFVFCRYLAELIFTQRMVMNTLLSRLPDRCAVCHREIVDEGGIIDEDGESIYHGACMDKLGARREARRKAKVKT
jgi:hypothetical protein